MTIQKKISDQMKEAMLKRDALKSLVLKGLIAAFTNELVAKGRKPGGQLTDEEALSVIKRAVKQRKDSIEQFGKGNRWDLVSAEEAELKVLLLYVPAEVSRRDIEKVVTAKKEELAIFDKSKMGVLMGAVMKELKGNANGAIVKEVVENSFNNSSDKS